jgi:hypothetical protein
MKMLNHDLHIALSSILFFSAFILTGCSPVDKKNVTTPSILFLLAGIRRTWLLWSGDHPYSGHR